MAIVPFSGFVVNVQNLKIICKNYTFQYSTKLKFLSSLTMMYLLSSLIYFSYYTAYLLYKILVIFCAALNCTFECDLLTSQYILQPLRVDLVLLATKKEKKETLLTIGNLL